MLVSFHPSITRHHSDVLPTRTAVLMWACQVWYIALTLNTDKTVFSEPSRQSKCARTEGVCCSAAVAVNMGATGVSNCSQLSWDCVTVARCWFILDTICLHECHAQPWVWVIIRDHCFPRAAEFRAEPRNLVVAAEFPCFRGISRNSRKFCGTTKFCNSVLLL